MKIFLKILNVIFVFLGVVFFILILIAAYFIIADPFDLKPIIKIIDLPSKADILNETGVIDRNPLLDSDQEKTLQTFGVDPAALPSEITPEMEKCFVGYLGEARVNEIMHGSEPTITDFFKARSCIDN